MWSALELFCCLPTLFCFLPLWKKVRLHGKKLQNATKRKDKLKSRIVTLKKWESQQGSIIVRSLNFLRAWKADSLRSLAKLSQRSWLSSDQEMMVTKLYIPSNKVENILKGSLDSIPSPSPSMKIQIMGGKVCFRCKGKTLLGVVNKLLKTKGLLTSPSKVLPLLPQVNFPACNLNFH